MRSASSEKRSSGEPTQRMSRLSMSSRPPKGSVRFPAASMAMAFTVKSRRARSASRLEVKRTPSGRRRSLYAPSTR